MGSGGSPYTSDTAGRGGAPRRRGGGSAVLVYPAKKVMTMNPMAPHAETVAVLDDRIFDVGTHQDVVGRLRAGRRPYHVDVRFADSILLPGFVEPHAHVVPTGLNWLAGTYVGTVATWAPDGTDVAACTSVGDVLDRLRGAARARTGSGSGSEDLAPLVAWGHDPARLPGQPALTRRELDAVAADRPVVVEHVSGHIAYVNSRALAAMGVQRGHPAAEDGIVRDAGGEPTGELREMKALARLARVPGLLAGAGLHGAAQDSPGQHGATHHGAAQHGAGPPGRAGATAGGDGRDGRDATMAAAVGLTGQLAQLTGTTTVTDMSAGAIDPGWAGRDASAPADIEAMFDAAARDDFPGRLVIYLDAAVAEEMGPKAFAELRARGGDAVTVAGVKFVLDGPIQGYTAALRFPHLYYDGAPDGVLNVEEGRLAERVEAFHRAGAQIALHAHGDRAIDLALRVLGGAIEAHPRAGHRHRIEHNQLVTEDQLRRIRELGICCNQFVNHIYYWGEFHLARTLGPRAARLNPLASLRRHGIPFALHSDCAVTPLDPLFSAWVAATRMTESGRVLGPAEKISVRDALRAITIDAAYLLGVEASRGSVDPGKLADLVALDGLPSDEDPYALRAIRPTATVVGGRVFPAPSAARRRAAGRAVVGSVLPAGGQ